MAQTNLDKLNAFRAAEGKEAFKDWRKARHQPMLDAYEQAAADAEYAARKQAEDDAKARREAEEKALEEAASKKGYASRVKVAKEEAKTKVAPINLAKIAGNADFADHTELQQAAEEKAKSTSYKAVANYADSAIEKPVAFVHQFLSDNPDMSRKAAVIALTEGYGINFSTARTQYQRWFTARKKGA